MAGVKKKISQLSLEEVKSIELLNGGKIPLLSEALESFPSLRFNIDIKTEDALEETVKIVEGRGELAIQQNPTGARPLGKPRNSTRCSVSYTHMTQNKIILV